MKHLIIHDTSDPQGLEILGYLKDKASESGREVKFLDLGKVSRHPCRGCFNCWVKTPGKCIFNDDAQAVMKEEINSDRVMYICPVTWGGYSPALKILLDRSIGKVLPFFVRYKGETHHPGRYDSNPVPYLTGYGKGIDQEEEELFRRCGENLNDNIHRDAMNTVVIREKSDFSALDRFLEGEEA